MTTNRKLTKFEARIKRRFTQVVGRTRFRAEICIGTQSFIVQRFDGTRKDAEWYRRQAAIALARFYEYSKDLV